MATLYITELTYLAFVGSNSNQHAQVPSVDFINAFQTVALSGSSSVSHATNINTKFLKLVSDTDCWLNFSNSSGTTASTSSDYLPSGVIYYVGVSPGSFISAIT